MPDWNEYVRNQLQPLSLEDGRETEIVAELAQHLEASYDEALAQGASSAEARADAEAQIADWQLLGCEIRRAECPLASHLPNRPRAATDSVDSRKRSKMLNFLPDFKFAFRSLVKQPGFSLIVVGMLALGIAGNVAIFSIFNGLFVRPFPLPEPERLVDLDETAPKWNLEYLGISYPDFHAWREQNQVFEGMAVWDAISFNLSFQGTASRIEGARVTHDLGSVLGIRPILGRDFRVEDDRPGAPGVVLLGFGFWQRDFGGDPNVIDAPLRLDSQTYTIVGVLPPEAIFPDDVELWLPLAANPDKHEGWFLNGLGRLKEGITLDRASEDLTRIHRTLIELRPRNEITSPKVTPLRERYLGNLRVITSLLQGAVGAILLIACANVAGLMLAKGMARAREIGVRLALGATRRRIMQQLLTESLMLSIGGGLVGAILGYWSMQGLISLMPAQLPAWVSYEVDLRFLMFCLFLTMATALLFGLVPILQASRISAREVLEESGARFSSTLRRQTKLNAVVVGEIALAMVLLIGAGLLVRTFLEVQKVDPGFSSDNILTYRIFLPAVKYPEGQQQIAFFQDLLRRNRALPGVQNAAASTAPPLGSHWGDFFEIENAPPLDPDEQDPVTLVRVITPGYFQTMGVTLLSGSPFTESDGRDPGSHVVIVNETFAKRSWPDEDPIGKRIRYREEGRPWWTVVGVAQDVKHYGLDKEMLPGVYVPLAGTPVPIMAVVLRSSTDPLSLLAAVRETVREMDADLPIFEIATMSEKLDDSLWVRRSYSTLFGAFAAVALILACGGIYGVISYSVSRRTHEIGIRMALGAGQGKVLRQILGSGMKLASIGVAIGVAGAVWASELLETMLFGISTGDPLTHVIVTLLLVVVALFAIVLPARRATQIDPIHTLRSE